MKKDKKMPMFQALKLNIRALMVIYQKFPQMVLSRLILQSWLAITPYVGIYLSALVIDELGGTPENACANHTGICRIDWAYFCTPHKVEEYTGCGKII